MARIPEAEIDYYHQALKESPEALAYLEKRGIANSEAIDHFKLGFANRTLGYRLPAKNRKEGAAIRGQLQGHKGSPISLPLSIEQTNSVKQVVVF